MESQLENSSVSGSFSLEIDGHKQLQRSSQVMEYNSAVWLLMAVRLSRRILKTSSRDKQIFGNIISCARIDLFKQQPYFQHLANRHNLGSPN